MMSTAYNRYIPPGLFVSSVKKRSHDESDFHVPVVKRTLSSRIAPFVSRKKNVLDVFIDNEDDCDDMARKSEENDDNDRKDR